MQVSHTKIDVAKFLPCSSKLPGLNYDLCRAKDAKDSVDMNHLINHSTIISKPSDAKKTHTIHQPHPPRQHYPILSTKNSS